MLLLFLFIFGFGLFIFGFSLGAFRLAPKWHNRTRPDGVGLGNGGGFGHKETCPKPDLLPFLNIETKLTVTPKCRDQNNVFTYIYIYILVFSNI